MKLKSSQVCAALGLLSLFLSSCTSSGGVDAVNPTVSAMDKLDAQWGLPPRQTKGTPHSKYAPAASAQNAPAAAYSPQPAAAAPAPASAPEPAAPSLSAPITVDPSVIQKLR